MPAPPTPGRMLARGLARRCPRCGAGRLFRRWFHLAERCPGCGLRFARRAEDSLFLGAFVVNVGVTEGALALVLAGYVVARSQGGGGPLWPVLAVATAVAVVLPLAFYPFSRTLWLAIDLAMRPLTEAEAADAEAAAPR
jgi:uncharacterized protein (DUF983 family)